MEVGGINEEAWFGNQAIKYVWNTMSFVAIPSWCIWWGLK